MVVPSYESLPAVHRIGASLVFQESRSRAAAGMVQGITTRCVRRKVLLVSSERCTATLRLRRSSLVAYRVVGDFHLLRGAHWSIAHLSGRALGHRCVGSVPHRGGIAQHRSAGISATRQKGCAGHAQKNYWLSSRKLRGARDIVQRNRDYGAIAKIATTWQSRRLCCKRITQISLSYLRQVATLGRTFSPLPVPYNVLGFSYVLKGVDEVFPLWGTSLAGSSD